MHAEATPAALAEPQQDAGGSAEMPGDVRSSQPVEPIRNMGQKVGRNDPCPCGSGKKFKNCFAKSSGVPLG